MSAATEHELLARIDALTDSVRLMASMLGTRLDRAQLCERMGICSAWRNAFCGKQNITCKRR